MNNELTQLLTPVEAAQILAIDPETLNVWRCTQRYDLPYIKVGRLVRYKKTDIEKFIEANTSQSPPIPN